MLNISQELKDLLKKDSVHKRLIIRFPNGEHDDITNDQILTESMVLKELLCSQDELHFGTCNTTKFEVTIAEVVANIKGCVIRPVIALNNSEIPLGIYTVSEVEKNAGKPYKKITAYNRMRLFDKDVKSWYGNLKFPMTLKSFRDSLCSHVGLQQVSTTLVNDNLSLQQTLDATQVINGLELIQAVCEINGVFGDISRDGKFKYVTLNTNYGLYPSEDLYPSNDLYPNEGESERVDAVLKSIPVIDDYETAMINGVAIGDNDVYYETDSHTNPYIIKDNILLYDRQDLKSVADKIASKINGIFYRPAEITAVGLPYLELGDSVVCSRKADFVQTFILERTLKGIQSLTDVYQAKGQEFFNKDYNSIGNRLKRLNRQYGQVRTNVETTSKGLVAEVTRATTAEGTLRTSITTLSDEVGIKISKDGTVTTNLTLDKNGMAFTGNKLVINTTNFKLNADGSVSVTGAVNATSGSFKGSIDATSFNSSFTYQNYTYSIYTGGSRDFMLVMDAKDASKKTTVDSLFGPGGIMLRNLTSNTQTNLSYDRISTQDISASGLTSANGGVKVSSSGTQIKSITAGTNIFTGVSGTSQELFSSGVSASKDIIVVTNGDGVTNGAHFEGVTIQNNKAYVLFDRALSNATARINWIRFTLA